MKESKSKNKKKLTKEILYRSSEFWLENLRSELFTMVQDYMNENDLNRTELAAKLGVSKGYVSQVLNGSTNHSLSKFVSLVTELGKAPYIYLKDIGTVLAENQSGKSVYIDFNDLESKAKMCDLMRLESMRKTKVTKSIVIRPFFGNTKKYGFKISKSNSVLNKPAPSYKSSSNQTNTETTDTFNESQSMSNAA